jgi:hypothetical protein
MKWFGQQWFFRTCSAKIVALPRDLRDRGHDVSLRRRVTSEFVGYNSERSRLLAFQELSEETSCSSATTPFLHKNVDDVSILIYRSPAVRDDERRRRRGLGDRLSPGIVPS